MRITATVNRIYSKHVLTEQSGNAVAMHQLLPLVDEKGDVEAWEAPDCFCARSIELTTGGTQDPLVPAPGLEPGQSFL